MSNRLNTARGSVLVCILVLLAAATAARAELDPPSSGTLFGFPGAFPTPASPISAGRALADRWLGESPWDNPAGGAAKLTAEGALLFLREDRQDLRADNSQFDGGSGSIDFGSVAVGGRLPAQFTGWLYAYRPEARWEDVAFYLGRGTDPTLPSALVTAHTNSSETRSGAGLSRGFGALRVGFAIEITSRRDEWKRTLESGAPESGTRTTEWHGSATGGQLGFRWTHGDSTTHALAIGGALRRIPELSISGDNNTDLLTGASDSSVTTTRAAGWEGGVSLAYGLGPAVRMTAGAGTRSAMDWSGLGLTSGRWNGGSLAFDYHDPEAPWTFRIGYALDQQSAVPEEHAGSLGLGFGWDFGGTVVEFGGVHRGLRRPGEPTAYEDRVLLGFRTVLF